MIHFTIGQEEFLVSFNEYADLFDHPHFVLRHRNVIAAEYDTAMCWISQGGIQWTDMIERPWITHEVREYCDRLWKHRAFT
jgi:hypothetical protein